MLNYQKKRAMQLIAFMNNFPDKCPEYSVAKCPGLLGYAEQGLRDKFSAYKDWSLWAGGLL